jgi:hypothetical protein
VHATCDEIDGLAAEIVTTVTSADDPKAGVAAARELLQSRREAIGAKLDAMGSIPAGDLEPKTQQRMLQTLLRASGEVDQLRMDLLQASTADRALAEDLQDLTDAFAETVRL